MEYVDNEMVVTDTPVVTNFYLTEGEKHGIGTEQSHTRYDQSSGEVQYYHRENYNKAYTFHVPLQE